MVWPALEASALTITPPIRIHGLDTYSLIRSLYFRGELEFVEWRYHMRIQGEEGGGGSKNVFIQYISNVALVIFLFTVFVIFALNYASVSFEKNALPLFPLLEMSGSDSVSYQP